MCGVQPLALMMVPTRELGAQLAIMVSRLLGGNSVERRPGDPANMFTYQVSGSAHLRSAATPTLVHPC